MSDTLMATETGTQAMTDELLKNRRAYSFYNQFKIDRTLQTLSSIDRLVFTVIPRLVHVHQEYLPGYIEGPMPAGIFNYTINKETEIASEALFPNLILRRAPTLKPFVHTILLMGSIGSIAQTKKSDLDYTLVISKNSVSAEEMDLLKKKLQLIEKWAWDNYHIEVHFFLNDAEEIRNNIFGESDSESTGSALAKLLKEEMYRTAVILAGKIPFWMMVPVQTSDKQYAHLYHQVKEGKTLLHPQDYIDMGNVEDISRGEFFGGSIWALIKSFQSPFKTLMKMGLLENYMFGETKSNLLCHEVKRRVFTGVAHLTIDPYIMLFKRVETFFKEHKTEFELDALRTAFYLKVGTQVMPEEFERGASDFKKSTLIDLIRDWAWSPTKLDQINKYAQWQMMQKVSLGTQVNKILMNSYKNISEKNKTLDPKESLITERDTHLLGRKLFSYYSKTPNKVENLFALVDGKTAEKEITFLYNQENAKDKGDWYLVRGKTLAYLEHIPKENLIKKASTLQFLVAFTAYNNMYNSNTNILLRAEEQSIKDYDLHILLEQISKFIARVNIASLSNDDLLSEAYIKQLFTLIDFGNPMPREVTLGDLRDCKTHDEYSAFINRRLERILSVTVIYMTSWGELYCKGYSGVNSMTRCLDDIAPQIPVNRIEDPNLLKIYIPCGRKEALQMPWLNKYMLHCIKTSGKPLTANTAS
jgi:adenylate cyclase class 1